MISINKFPIFFTIILFFLSACAYQAGGRPSGRVIHVRAVSLPEKYINVTIGRTSQRDVVSMLGRPNNVHFRTSTSGRNLEIFEYIPHEIILKVSITGKSGVAVDKIYSPGRENILYMEFTNGILTSI
jgi:hypothetical protein